MIADEVFTEGIQWPHIVTLLLFGSELAFALGVASVSNDSFVNHVNDWLIKYFSSNQCVKDWILSHDHWNGLVTYAGVTQRRLSRRTSLLAVGSIATVAVATLIHYFLKA